MASSGQGIDGPNESRGDGPKGLFARAKAILTRPREAWGEIGRDMTPSGELFTRYAAPLALLAPVAGFIAGRVFGWSPFGGHIVGQLFTAVSGYAFTLINLLVMSFIASKLAPRFGGEGSPRDAFKLIVYSSTAAWLASAVAMIPGFGFVGLAAFYSLYLFFTGIGPIMKVPEENKARFGFVTIACAIGLNLVTSLISNGPAMALGGPPTRAEIEDRSGFSIDGEDVRFETGELRQVGEQIRKAVQRGNVKSIAAGELQALLPASIAGFERTELESRGSGNGPSRAEATYERGRQEFKLKVVDLGNLGAVAQIGRAFRVEKNRQDKDGYERVNNSDGRLVAEKWDNDDEEGRYMTMIGNRFLIEAEGEADSIEALKSAVSSIDPAKLDALAK